MTAARQLLLDLDVTPPPSFETFLGTANRELLAHLRQLVPALMNKEAVERSFYLWGESGSGRSHLLQALCYATPAGHARFASPKSSLAAFDFDPAVMLYAIDDCHVLNPAQQIAVFNLFNEVRAHPGSAFVAAGSHAPLALAVREDLRTRLGWGLVFQVISLQDTDKPAALYQAARARGLTLAEDVPAYLLTHCPRDMGSLMRLLDALDRYSLEQQRAVTMPLLRAMLASIQLSAA
jgi:DnaA family protein